MLTLGWKKKALHLKMVLLSAGHQIAKELPPSTQKLIVGYRRAHGGDLSAIGSIEKLASNPSQEQPPLWEPLAIYGWNINATFYREDQKLWWLVHAQRRSDVQPSEKEVAFLEKIVEVLGGDATRDVIIGPRSPVASEPGLLGFGWWTWINQENLFEVQVNKHKKGKDAMRIVPQGTRPKDGYEHVDLTDCRDRDDPDGADKTP